MLLASSLQRGLRFRPSSSAPLLPRRLRHRTETAASSSAVAMASSSGGQEEKPKQQPEPVDPATLFDGGAGAADLRALCVGACSRDTPLLSRADLDARLRSLPAWSLSPDGTLLSREFRAKNFAAAVAFLSAAADVAEAAGHHPDFHLTEWNRVRVDATTHAAGGITLADASLAAKLDAVPVVYSPKWLREQAAAAAAKEGEGGR